MDKAPDAFRTISEVAEALETPAHVLRFWESRFPQIKPVKRAGGRRYYRPADVALLSGIRHLLHSEGMTIRGVQKVLREQGVRHVAALGGGDMSDLDLEAADQPDATDIIATSGAQILPLDSLPRRLGEGTEAHATTGHSAEIQSLFPTEATKPAALAVEPALDLTVPREGDGGFIAFSNPRGPRPKARPPEADRGSQPTLPLDLTPAVAEVPEAPHVWAEPDLQPPAEPTALPCAAAPDDVAAQDPATGPTTASIPDGIPDGAPQAADAGHTPDAAVEADVPDLAGVAARLRDLRGPLDPAVLASLDDLHARLGLVHAQMAEALRLRR